MGDTVTRDCPECGSLTRVKRDGSLYKHPCTPRIEDPTLAVRKGPWFGAQFDGECDGCDGAVYEGEMIRADGSGGWECEAWCGQDDPVSEAPATVAAMDMDNDPEHACSQGIFRYQNQCPIHRVPDTDPLAGTDPTPPKPAPTTVSGQPEARRDHYGRYKLKFGGAGLKGYTRATTFAKELSNTFGIAQWQQRNVAIGLSKRPDLAAQVIGKDVREDRKALNQICDAAREAAGEKIASSAGTAVHHLTEQVDAGLLDLASVPAQFRNSVGQYLTVMAIAGLVVVPELIERTTITTKFGEAVAGTLDRVVKCPDGRYRVADVKTGRDPLEYGEKEITTQLLLYVEGLNENGVYDWNDDTWHPLSELGIPRIEDDFAIVIHLPLEGDQAGGCYLHEVRFTEAARVWARMCATVRAGKKDQWSQPLRGLWIPAERRSLVPVKTTEDGWRAMMGATTGRDEANDVYRRAKAGGASPALLADLIAIGKDASMSWG